MKLCHFSYLLGQMVLEVLVFEERTETVSVFSWEAEFWYIMLCFASCLFIIFVLILSVRKFFFFFFFESIAL